MLSPDSAGHKLPRDGLERSAGASQKGGDRGLYTNYEMPQLKIGRMTSKKRGESHLIAAGVHMGR